LASYNKFNNNVFRDAVVIACANCATSLYAGFVVFSFVGFMAYELDKPVEEVAKTGPGLAFVVYPEAVSLLPGSKIWAILFFTMLLALGLGTQFSLMETVVSIIVDSWPRKWGKANRNFVLIGSCATMFAVGLSMVTEGGMYVLTLMDNHAGTFSALITGCVEVAVLAWIYGAERFVGDINSMLHMSSGAFKIFRAYWRVMWRFVTPVICVSILIATFLTHEPISYDGKPFPAWANALGWVVSFVSVSCIPGVALAKLASAPGSTLRDRLRSLLRTTEQWGPRDSKERMISEKRWRDSGYGVSSATCEGVVIPPCAGKK